MFESQLDSKRFPYSRRNQLKQKIRRSVLRGYANHQGITVNFEACLDLIDLLKIA